MEGSKREWHRSKFKEGTLERRLSRYLLVEYGDAGYDEPRSKTISVMEAVDYVLKNCTHSLNGTQIKRYISKSDVARFTDPAKGKARAWPPRLSSSPPIGQFGPSVISK